MIYRRARRVPSLLAVLLVWAGLACGGKPDEYLNDGK